MGKKKRKVYTAKVWMRKSNKQKLVTIPAKSEIKEGDVVCIKKMDLDFEL